MDFSNLKLVLIKLGISVDNLKPNNKGWVVIPCPLAPWTHKMGSDGHPSFGIICSPKLSSYKCFSCGQHGPLWKLVQLLGQLRSDKELLSYADKVKESDSESFDSVLARADSNTLDFCKSLPVNPKIALDEAQFCEFVKWDATEESKDYLVGRNLDAETLNLFDIRYDPISKRVVFPIRNSTFDLVGAQGRAIDKDTRPKYFNYFRYEKDKVLGGEHIIDSSCKCLIIVEGWFDLLRIYPWLNDCGAVCTFGASMSEQQAAKISRLAQSVILWYDNDLAGKQGTTRAINLLKSQVSYLKPAIWNVPTDLGGTSRECFEAAYLQTVRS